MIPEANDITEYDPGMKFSTKEIHMVMKTLEHHWVHHD